MRIVLILLFCVLAGPVIAQDQPVETLAEEMSPSLADFTELKRIGSAQIDQVIDGLTLTLKDNKIIRLAGIDIPGDGNDDTALQAYTALQKLAPERTDVVIYQTRMAKKGRENRMGQLFAHLVTAKSPVWFQGYLLEKGLARAMPTETNPEMAAQMYALEEAARKEQLGIWAEDSFYRLRSPTDMEGTLGTVQVVEGTVVKAASVKNNLYLNFGEDWRTDFTVQISTTIRKQLARAHIDPMSLQGKTIRIRGYIEEYNGPMIKLETLTHLEFIEAEAQP